MSEVPATYNADNAALLEQVVVKGDLKDLTPAQRVSYYKQVCDSLGVNPLTKPFQYITLQGRLSLYATRDATDQLRRRNGVSIIALDERQVDDVYIVKATAKTSDGRTDTSTGAVSIKGLSGEALANALMKAETKAKRRVTLSIVGLGWLDETETESIPDARPVQVADSGEIVNGSAKPADATVLELRAELMALGKRLADAGLQFRPIDPERKRSIASFTRDELAAHLAYLQGIWNEAQQAPVEQEALV